MFDCPKYLYHYTSISTLAAILKNETIRFSNLTKVDDLEESKYSTYGKYVFVSCWTEKVDEDIPTWIMYGNKMEFVPNSVEIESDSSGYSLIDYR
jgi:hypothetical protein